ncbi:TIM barrel protein [Haladaptatus caseinilyticus]|uniref:TIM barrel protein n=1 Tax=Haladaptatus caseinilyticus TaxID=2993314 RepID=UPI00224B0E22|nr:TIM barrel protein [Haladaptatus caseinilyticus]
MVEVFRRVAPVAEKSNVTLLLEPLNTRVDHPGHFVSTARDGVEIIKEVSSPAVRVLYDIYHEQIMAGDIIHTFQKYVEYIGHVHIADNPGRHEPGMGELDYENILESIADSEYDGYIGCEFTPTGDPEKALEHVRSLL